MLPLVIPLGERFRLIFELLLHIRRHFFLRFGVVRSSMMAAFLGYQPKTPSTFSSTTVAARHSGHGPVFGGSIATWVSNKPRRAVFISSCISSSQVNSLALRVTDFPESASFRSSAICCGVIVVPPFHANPSHPTPWRRTG